MVPMVRLQKTVESPQLQSFQVVCFSFAAQRQCLMVQTLCQTIDIPQLLNTVADVPVVRSYRFSRADKVVDVPVVHDRADFPVVVQMPLPMVQTVRRTMVFPQFVLDKVIVGPVVQVERDSHVPSWRRLSCSHSCTLCGRGSSSSR